jgi:hypothetical protein
VSKKFYPLCFGSFEMNPFVPGYIGDDTMASGILEVDMKVIDSWVPLVDFI